METIKKNKESIMNYLKDLDSYDLVNLSNEFSQNHSFFDNEGNLVSFNYLDDYIEFDMIAEAILNDNFEVDNLEFEI